MAREGHGLYRSAGARTEQEAPRDARPLELDALLAPFREFSWTRRAVAMVIATTTLVLSALLLVPPPVHAGDQSRRTVEHPALTVGAAAIVAASLGVWAVQTTRARELEPERLRPMEGWLARHGSGWRLHADDGRTYTARPMWERARHLPERRVRAWVHPRLRIAVLEYDYWTSPRRALRSDEMVRACDQLRATPPRASRRSRRVKDDPTLPYLLVVGRLPHVARELEEGKGHLLRERLAALAVALHHPLAAHLARRIDQVHLQRVLAVFYPAVERLPLGPLDEANLEYDAPSEITHVARHGADLLEASVAALEVPLDAPVSGRSSAP